MVSQNTWLQTFFRISSFVFRTNILEAECMIFGWTVPLNTFTMTCGSFINRSALKLDEKSTDSFIVIETCLLVNTCRVKVDRPQEVVTGSPTVIKMLVSFYRHARGQNALKDVLGPAIRDVLQDRSLNIRSDPVEIYKSWVNQSESQTGQKRCVCHTQLHPVSVQLYSLITFCTRDSLEYGSDNRIYSNSMRCELNYTKKKKKKVEQT